jgi:hypothetical protein
MAKVRDIDVKKLSTSKREFISALKKVSQKIQPDEGEVGNEYRSHRKSLPNQS